MDAYSNKETLEKWTTFDFMDQAKPNYTNSNEKDSFNKLISIIGN